MKDILNVKLLLSPWRLQDMKVTKSLQSQQANAWRDSKMSTPPRKYEKGQVLYNRSGPPLRVNSYYFSAFSDSWRYFGSYISRDGTVMAHNDKTVGTDERSLEYILAPSLKEYRKKLTASERMERL